jgi:hypothetical protein
MKSKHSSPANGQLVARWVVLRNGVPSSLFRRRSRYFWPRWHRKDTFGMRPWVLRHECPFEMPYPCVAAHSPIQSIASSIVPKDRSLTGGGSIPQVGPVAGWVAGRVPDSGVVSVEGIAVKTRFKLIKAGSIYSAGKNAGKSGVSIFVGNRLTLYRSCDLRIASLFVDTDQIKKCLLPRYYHRKWHSY